MHKNATKCNETLSKWCKNKHGASKIIDTFETYHLLFGSFKDPIHADGSKDFPGKFIGSNFNYELCKTLPYHALLEVQDLQQA
jgi:hypothetical protein